MRRLRKLYVPSPKGGLLSSGSARVDEGSDLREDGGGPCSALRSLKLSETRIRELPAPPLLSPARLSRLNELLITAWLKFGTDTVFLIRSDDAADESEAGCAVGSWELAFSVSISLTATLCLNRSSLRIVSTADTPRVYFSMKVSPSPDSAAPLPPLPFAPPPPSSSSPPSPAAEAAITASDSRSSSSSLAWKTVHVKSDSGTGSALGPPYVFKCERRRRLRGGTRFVAAGSAITSRPPSCHVRLEK